MREEWDVGAGSTRRDRGDEAQRMGLKSRPYPRFSASPKPTPTISSVSVVAPTVQCAAWCGVVWCGVVWCGVVWCGVVWCGVVWCGVVWCGVVWCGVVWCGVVWCGVVWCGVVWCGVVWCGVVWCGVVWCGVVWCGVMPWATGCGTSLCTRSHGCAQWAAASPFVHHRPAVGSAQWQLLLFPVPLLWAVGSGVSCSPPHRCGQWATVGIILYTAVKGNGQWISF